MISANTITAAYGRVHKGNPHKSSRASRLRLSEKSRKHTYTGGVYLSVKNSGKHFESSIDPSIAVKTRCLLVICWWRCCNPFFFFSFGICNTGGVYFRLWISGVARGNMRERERERFFVCNEGHFSDESLTRAFLFEFDLLFYLNVVPR